MTMQPYELDLRAILYEGGNPFDAVMSAVSALRPGQSLRLITPFEPLPLYEVLGARGFSPSGREIENGNWEALFTPAPVPSM